MSPCKRAKPHAGLINHVNRVRVQAEVCAALVRWFSNKFERLRPLTDRSRATKQQQFSARTKLCANPAQWDQTQSLRDPFFPFLQKCLDARLGCPLWRQNANASVLHLE